MEDVHLTQEKVSLREVLVVEDHRPTAAALRKLLLNHGFRADLALDVADAKAAVKARQGRGYDVAIFDVHLPDGDGIELARSIRQDLGNECRVILLTGDHSIETLRRSSEPSVVDQVLGKPVSTEALHEALQPVAAEVA
jgi:DNA-binding response OmpR family regulator